MKLNLTAEPRREHCLPNGDKLVLLDVLGAGEKYPREEHNCNIFLVDRNGKIMWRIAYHEEGYRGSDPFVGITESEGSVIGITWGGWSFEINLSDGSLKKLGWTK